MEIISKGGRIDRLGLKLDSMQTNLSLVFDPFDFSSPGVIKPINMATIHFKDTRELDTLIYALQKFRSKNNNYIGDWMEE